MTRQKTLKKVVRARAAKTGESYTAARRQVLDARAKSAGPAPAAATTAPAATKSPTKRTLSDAAVLKKTGHDYRHWFAVLDQFGATEKGHTAAARHLASEHGILGWHAQGITVEYERTRGLRVTNQTCAGDFHVTVSRAMAAPITEIADAMASAKRRSRWVPAAVQGLGAALRTAFDGPQAKGVKFRDAAYATLRFSWDGLPVELRITASPRGAGVVADSRKLSGPDQVESRRTAWRLALDALKRHLES
jgi:hypothetical protein